MNQIWRDKIAMLLLSDKITEREKKTFDDILTRDPETLSIKQETMFNKAYQKYIDSTATVEPETSFINCCVEYYNGEGYFIVDNDGKKIGPSVTKTEGIIIARWFDKTYSSTSPKTETEKDQEDPF